MNKKISLLMCLILMTFTLSGCMFKNVFKNEVETKYIDYSQNITVNDIESALVEGAEIAKSSSIAIIASSKGLLGSNDSLGSGVILKRTKNNDDTYTYLAVTNYHVLDSTRLSEIHVYDGKNIISASLVTYKESVDLALVSFTTGILMNTATLYLNELKTAQFVIAVGSPYDVYGFYNTVTVGSISCPSRNRQEEYNGKTIKNTYIQHDAAINSGNSGGGLYDIYGRLIGINTWKIVGELGESYEGLNFAIPISVVYVHFNNYLK